MLDYNPIFLQILNGEKMNTVSVIICVAIMVVATVFYIFLVLSQNNTKKYEKILYPTKNAGQAPKMELQKDKKRYKKPKKTFKEKINNFSDKKGWTSKIESWYLQAGYKDKHAEDFIIGNIKIALVALVLSVLLYFLFQNILISFASLLILVFPFINMFSEISERKKEFNREFPYFLQTLAFVLQNGANMATAFEEVVNKQSDGVLKQVMEDVLRAVKIEGGNFGKAFSTIPKQIDTEETREFIDIVQNQLEKGAPVADVFKLQSAMMTERFQIKQTKKIASASTKIFVPLLLIMLSIAVFFLEF